MGFIRKRMAWSRILVRYFCCALLFVFVVSMHCPVLATSDVSYGWIEVKAEVPDDLQREIILSVIHVDTEEEFDFQIVNDNGYVLREKLPLGSYVISAVFVNQDFRYNITADVHDFTVTDLAAVPIALKVEIDQKYWQESENPTLDTDNRSTSVPETMESSNAQIHSSDGNYESNQGGVVNNFSGTEEDSTTQVEAEQREDKSFRVFAKNIIIAILGTGVFVGIVMLIVYWVRKSMGMD